MADTDQKAHGALPARGAVREVAILCAFALGWLVLTLGVWGATGRHWWIWALSVGIGLIAVGGTMVWIVDQEVAAEVRRELDVAPPARQRPVSISSSAGRRA